MRKKIMTNVMRRIILKQREESKHISDFNIIWDLIGIEDVADE